MATARIPVLVVLAGFLWGSVHGQSPSPASSEDWLFEDAFLPEEGFGLVGPGIDVVPSKGDVNVLVVFAQFQGEGDQSIPDYAPKLFDLECEGSFTHFYHTMSFGQLRVYGTVLPKRYTSDRPAAAYLASRPGYLGRYSDSAQEILQQTDADIDLGRFVDDGPDGLPNSGDDDGVVDYVFVCLRSVPQDFIIQASTGITGLGKSAYYWSADPSLRGAAIRLSGAPAHGAMLEARTFALTVGSMAHEFGHSLGLPDLYVVALS